MPARALRLDRFTGHLLIQHDVKKQSMPARALRQSQANILCVRPFQPSSKNNQCPQGHYDLTIAICSGSSHNIVKKQSMPARALRHCSVDNFSVYICRQKTINARKGITTRCLRADPQPRRFPSSKNNQCPQGHYD
jgi:hypothetical protein